MPAPTNISAALATDIPSLPYSTLQQVDFGGTTYTVWWKYTVPAGERSLGARGANANLAINYIPKVEVYQDAGITAYLSLAPVDVPFQMPVVTATTYYFKISSTTGNVSPAMLQFDVYRGPRDPIPIGSILVNDDTTGFPGVIVGADGDVLNIAAPMPAGEAGDILSNGTFILNDFNAETLTVFDSQFNIVGTPLAIGTSDPKIRTCQGAQVFYVAVPGNPVTVKTVTAAAAFGAVTHSLTAITSVLSIAADNTEAILYHAANATGAAIRRWDLVGGAALSDLAAGIATFYVPDILVLGDDSIVASYINLVSGVFQVKRYNAAGTTLNTYSLGTTTIPSFTLPRMAYGTGSTSFWVWTHPSSGNSRFREIQVSDGTVLQTIDVLEFESGTSDTGNGTFGISFSCPFFVLRETITESNDDESLFVSSTGDVIYPDFESDPRVIVVDRIAPTLNSENRRIFYSSLELLMEVGVGLTTGQGSDPLIQMRLSNDSGKTWSNFRTCSFGAIGEYEQRVIWRQLGSGRNRVFWVRISDPVFVGIHQAFLSLEAGAH